MKTLLHQIIVLSILVINLDGTMQQPCVEGEPKPGQMQPDLNITIFPSTTIREGDNVTIKCDAGEPRFPDVDAGAVLLPTIIQIIVGNVTATCKHERYINTCDYVSSDFVKGRPKNVTCKAYNMAEECRVKSIEVNVNGEAASTTERPFTGNMTTHVPTTASNVSTKGSTRISTTSSSRPETVKFAIIVSAIIAIVAIVAAAVLALNNGK